MISTFGSRLETLRNGLKYNKQEFANILDIPASSLGRYESDSVGPGLDFFEKIANKIPSINLNWLIGRHGETFNHEEELLNDQNETSGIPERTNILLMTSFFMAYKEESFESFDKVLEQYIVRATFKEKLKFPQSVTFFGETLVGRWNRISKLRIFAKSLQSMKATSAIGVENAKEALISAIENYELSFSEKYNQLISEKHRKFAIDAVQEFSDFECLAILSDVDKALEILEDEKLTDFDKFHIPFVTGAVKLS